MYLFLVYAKAFMVNKYTLTTALFDTGLDEKMRCVLFTPVAQLSYGREHRWED
jgi:hypothetical protein